MTSSKKVETIKRVKCDSGIEGWQCSLHKNYDNDFEQFKGYDEMHGVAKHLGFRSAKAAWKANPTIQGSVIPSDFRKVK